MKKLSVDTMTPAEIAASERLGEELLKIGREAAARFKCCDDPACERARVMDQALQSAWAGIMQAHAPKTPDQWGLIEHSEQERREMLAALTGFAGIAMAALLKPPELPMGLGMVARSATAAAQHYLNP